VLIAILAAVALVLCPTLAIRDVRRERARRAALFEACLPLFQRYRVTREPGSPYPVLEGTYRGFAVRLEPVLDDMGVRKVPSLWLKATLLVANPDSGVLDLLVRPQGIETYSPAGELPVRLPMPPGWPQNAILCTDDAAAAPSLAALTSHVAAFEDPRMKELLITPRGVRLVYQAAQADRSEYLVLRQARFAVSHLPPDLARRLLDLTIAIATDLDATQDSAVTGALKVA
jgi:hypothetical protein